MRGPGAEGPDLRAAVGRGVRVALVFVLFGLGFAAVVTTLTDPDVDLRALFARIDPLRLALAWVVMTSGMVGLALRWRTFFPAGTHAPLAPLTAILFVGILLNYALPGPVGEVAGAALAARRFGVRTEAALAAGITARFVGLALAGVVAALLVESGSVPLPPDARPWIRTATLLLAVGGSGLAVLGAWPALLRRVADLTVGRFRLLRGLHASLLHFADALGALGRVGVGTYLRGVAWALVGHTAVVLGIAIAASGLGVAPSGLGLAFTYTATTAGSIALFAFPGGQFGWDALFSSLLHTAAGLDVPSAFALTLLVRLQQLTLVLAGAALLLRGMGDGSERAVG